MANADGETATRREASLAEAGRVLRSHGYESEAKAVEAVLVENQAWPCPDCYHVHTLKESCWAGEGTARAGAASHFETIDVPDRVYQELKAWAEVEGVSVAHMAEVVLREYLDKHIGEFTSGA